MTLAATQMTSTGIHASEVLPPSPRITAVSLQASCAASLTPSATKKVGSAGVRGAKLAGEEGHVNETSGKPAVAGGSVPSPLPFLDCTFMESPEPEFISAVAMRRS